NVTGVQTCALPISTLRDLTEYLLERHGAALATRYGQGGDGAQTAPLETEGPRERMGEVAPSKRERRPGRGQPSEPSSVGGGPVAVVGVRGRITGARSVDELRGVSSERRCVVGEVGEVRYSAWSV